MTPSRIIELKQYSITYFRGEFKILRYIKYKFQLDSPAGSIYQIVKKTKNRRADKPTVPVAEQNSTSCHQVLD